jgi:minor extracellular serine protease Vpr
LRRSVAFIAFAAALVSAVPAAADLQPIRRGPSEAPRPLVWAGTAKIPPQQQAGLVRVIVRLPGQPLARYGRSLQSGTRTKLNTASASSRAYLRRLEQSQRAAVAQLERAIPEATVHRRYQVVLNGLAISLPYKNLPQLVRLGFVTRVYPTLRYTLATNRSPDVIHAAAFAALKGAKGEGMKIAVVDDGLDNRNPFLNGDLAPPTGFPKGGLRWTNGKIIVARAFPGPGSGAQGRLAFHPQNSFHGTHVAGIAAGTAGTTAPRGPDHPATAGLSGVAPRAWVGNYRVFNVPSPVGFTAGTAEIVAAFEAAVEDGMDVINFSGGGTMADPINDALVETVSNVVASGVVPVIAAGNDREDFGLGTAGSPGTAPEAISVAAVSNEHVFATPLRVVAPGAPVSVRQLPYAATTAVPAAWTSSDQTLVDVGTLMGTNGRPVDRKLCGIGADPNDPQSNPLPAGSLRGAIVLASRGVCTFVSKAERARAAGAIGLVLADNRAGEANQIPLLLSIPAVMIADVDGSHLRAAMAETNGRTLVRFGRDLTELMTGRSGVVSSFSSGGPTAFGHQLKPDIAAPGSEVLSSTSPESAGSGTPFAVFAGTSMATPHVAGAAALLLQRHPNWTPRQVRSALMTTAGPAWADTARTQEAPVLLQGAGLVDLPAADEPRIFVQPNSLTFGDLNVNHGAQTASALVSVTDAGDGAGTWQIEVRPQAATTGVPIEPGPAVALAPGGGDVVPIEVRAAATARAGDNFGFVVLRRGEEIRRIPYYFAVIRPGLESKPVRPIQDFQTGDTRQGVSSAGTYRFPTWPFGPPGDYPNGAPMVEDGAETLYTTLIDEPVVNVGAAIWSNSEGSLVDAWLLGSKDENDVLGAGGTPVNVNSYTFGFGLDVGAAAGTFPRPKRYWISVDSGRDAFTGRSLAGRYTLHSWRNDVYPPVARLESRRVAAGRPLLVVRTFDFPAEGGDSGVDPTSLILSYHRALVAASFYDPDAGIAIFALPPQAPRLPVGRTEALLIVADYQEAKNVSTPAGSVLPNTNYVSMRIRAVAGPAATWVTPDHNECVRRRAELLVSASSTTDVRRVDFYDGDRRIARDRTAVEGLYSTNWSTAGADRGRHRLAAVVLDASGRTFRALRTVRICR